MSMISIPQSTMPIHGSSICRRGGYGTFMTANELAVGPEVTDQRRGRCGIVWLVPVKRACAGARPAHFAVEPAQALAVVDIVPGREDVNVKIDLARPFKRLLGDTLGAPGDVFEQAPVRGFEPEKIVAAVR